MEATAWIASVALVFTGTQAWVAHRKLRFDLFAKRFETWENINEAINEYRQEIEARQHRPGEVFTSENLRNIWTAERSMKVLFPTDVSACVTQIEEALYEYALAKANLQHAVDDRDGPAEAEAYRAYLQADRELRRSQGDLLQLVHRHIRQYGWAEIAGVQIRMRIARWHASRSH